jgi:general secretion pathway protein D
MRQRRAPAPPSVQADSATPDTGERVELNFVDADLPAVVRALARFTGRNFVVDSRVKGQLTLVSEAPVSPAVAYAMLAGALRMRGFAVLDAGGISRVVPEADAKLQGLPITTAGDNPPAGLATRVFTLQYENATHLVPVLRPMISPNNPINAYPHNNKLVVTDYTENLDRIAKVIAGIDTPASINADVIPIRHGVASDVAALAAQLLDNQGGADSAQQITVVADPRSNSVLVRASSPASAQLARDLVQRIDSPESQPGNMHVVYLRNAQATHLAAVLRGALTGQGGLSGDSSVGLNSGSGPSRRNADSGTPSGPGGSGMGGAFNSGPGGMSRDVLMGRGNFGGGISNNQQTAFSAGGATVQADPSTNTLIITAPAPLYRSLREVIDQLDQRRAQVMVESLIVEVTATQEAQFGVQWMAGGNRLGSSGTSVIAGGRYNVAGIEVSAATRSTIDALPMGLNLGIISGTTKVLGNRVMNLNMLATALASQKGANILSTPNLLTLDNEEASIVVGRTVPFRSGSYTTNNSGVGGNNPFQTFNREDVGLTLRVRPQISEDGTVKLSVYQEVSSIEGKVEQAAGGTSVTRKRALNTHVLVDDGHIVVLGGLLEDRGSDTSSGVPFLKDIPVLGALFRYDTREREKTNLMVFLRPYIGRTSQDARRVSLDRYDYMRRAQDNARPESRWTMPDMPVPALPALPGLPTLPGDPLNAPNKAIDNSPGVTAPAPNEDVPVVDLRAGQQRQTLPQAPPPTEITERSHAAPPIVEPPDYHPQPPTVASNAINQTEQDPRAVLVQIAKTNIDGEAQNIVRQLRNHGLSAYIQIAPGGIGAMVRARISADDESVDSIMTLLRDLGFQPIIL